VCPAIGRAAVQPERQLTGRQFPRTIRSSLPSGVLEIVRFSATGPPFKWRQPSGWRRKHAQATSARPILVHRHRSRGTRHRGASADTYARPGRMTESTIAARAPGLSQCDGSDRTTNTMPMSDRAPCCCRPTRRNGSNLVVTRRQFSATSLTLGASWMLAACAPGASGAWYEEAARGAQHPIQRDSLT
jgi:hypothetical protein